MMSSRKLRFWKNGEDLAKLTETGQNTKSYFTTRMEIHFPWTPTSTEIIKNKKRRIWWNRPKSNLKIQKRSSKKNLRFSRLKFAKSYKFLTRKRKRRSRQIAQYASTSWLNLVFFRVVTDSAFSVWGATWVIKPCVHFADNMYQPISDLNTTIWMLTSNSKTLWGKSFLWSMRHRFSK